jgi:hypothetical protein
MTVPAEVAFDRSIRQLFPEHLRSRYTGKFDFDPERDPVLNDLYALINEMYTSHADRFVAADNSSPRLYFDFIAGTALNALAFTDGEYSYVGLTVGLVSQIESLAAELVSAEPVRELFTYSGPQEDQISDLWTALVTSILQFVALHELGHHMHGHCLLNGELPVKVLEEYGPTNAELLDVAELHADEFDADGYAMTTLAENFLAGPVRSEMLEMIGGPRNEETDANLLTLITLAAGTWLFSLTRTDTDPRQVTDSDHPPTPARLFQAMNTLHDWLAENRAGSETWVSGRAYMQVMNVATSALKGGDVGELWDSLTSFLESAEGHAYLNSVQRVRQRRRESLKASRWRINS